MKFRFQSQGFKLTALSNEGAEILSYEVDAIRIDGDLGALATEFEKLIDTDEVRSVLEDAVCGGRA